MQKIVHICKDQTFIEAVKYLFNKTDKSNIYYVVENEKNQKLKHVKLDTNTLIVTNNELLKLADTIESDTLIVFHSLSKPFFEFIRSVKSKCTLIWIFFGMEIYMDPQFYSMKKLFAPETRKLIPKKNKNLKKQLKDNLRPYVRHFKPKLPLSDKEIKKDIFNSFKYIGILYKNEFHNVLKRGEIKNANYLFFTYYPLEFIVDINKPINFNKNKVMIGNSGYLTSNHFDVFNKLQKFNLKDQEVVLPLGYGDPNYIDNIIKNANNYLNCKIEFITDFLALEAYNKILSEVEIFILYTRRQQGVGNIIALLWHGAKIFLSKRNTFYHYLKRIGIKVYCYETELNKNSISKGLSKDQIQYNRNILYDHLNEGYIIKKLQTQLDDIMKVNNN